MKIYIKNMVSTRCKMVVQTLLEALGLHYTKLDLGEVEIKESMTPQQQDRLSAALEKSGLELIDDKNHQTIEKIKNAVREWVHHSDELSKVNFSDFLREKLKRDYTYLATFFSRSQGTTIEKYIIAHKIERAKELLADDEFNLTEIADRLRYSSVAHLSNQFKRVTGLTPSQFKHLHYKRRIALENV